MVERHNDQPFGHHREIEGYPAYGIGREKHAAIAGLKACAAKISSHLPHLFQEFFAGDADELLAVNFAEDDASGTALKLSENSFEEVQHERQKLSA